MKKIITLCIMSIMVVASFGAKERKKFKKTKQVTVSHVDNVEIGYSPSAGGTAKVGFGHKCAELTICKKGPGDCQPGRKFIPCP